MSVAITGSRFRRSAEAFADWLRIKSLWDAIRGSFFWPAAARRVRGAKWVAVALAVAVLAGVAISGFARISPAASARWMAHAQWLLRMLLVGMAAGRAAWLLGSPQGRSMLEQSYLAGVSADEAAIGIGLIATAKALVPTGLIVAGYEIVRAGFGVGASVFLPFDFLQIVLLQFWCAFHMADEAFRGKSREPKPSGATVWIGLWQPFRYSFAIALPAIVLLFAIGGGGALGPNWLRPFITLGWIAIAAWIVFGFFVLLPVLYLRAIASEHRELRSARLDLREFIQDQGSPSS